ncbi:MAG: hypothetical protein ACLFTR_03530 [Candidatus Woesearchaeota archaeon]
MTRLLFFSDLHLEGDGTKEKGLEEIVSGAKDKDVDKIAFGGDAVGSSPIMVANAFEQSHGIDSAGVYKNLSRGHYKTMEKILNGFDGEVHGIHGNHDPQGMHETIRSMDFTPNDEIGKVYLPNAELGNFSKTWEELEIGYKEDDYKHALEKRPPIMLWHQGPHDQQYGQSQEGQEMKFECPEEFKKLGEEVSINLYGHNHGSYVSYDAESGRFDINMTTQDGFYAIVEYDENQKPLACEVYRNKTISENPSDPKAVAQKMYENIAEKMTPKYSEDAA